MCLVPSLTSGNCHLLGCSLEGCCLLPTRKSAPQNRVLDCDAQSCVPGSRAVPGTWRALSTCLMMNGLRQQNRSTTSFAQLEGPSTMGTGVLSHFRAWPDLWEITCYRVPSSPLQRLCLPMLPVDAPQHLPVPSCWSLQPHRSVPAHASTGSQSPLILPGKPLSSSRSQLRCHFFQEVL